MRPGLLTAASGLYTAPFLLSLPLSRPSVYCCGTVSNDGAAVAAELLKIFVVEATTRAAAVAKHEHPAAESLADDSLGMDPEKTVISATDVEKVLPQVRSAPALALVPPRPTPAAALELKPWNET